MPTDEKRYAELARLLMNYDYLLIDTCSLMEEAFPDWMNVFEQTKRGYLKSLKHDFHAIVPFRCYEELKNHVVNRDNTPEMIEKAIAAARALRVIKWARFKKLLEITKKDKAENYADNAITVKVIHDRLTKRILIITQDKGLASDLLYWNHSQSQFGRFVAVYQFNNEGQLVKNYGKSNPNRDNNPTTKFNPASKKLVREEFHATPILKQPVEAAPFDANASEQRLRALLGNPNYPLDKKKKEVQSHLDGLAKMPKQAREEAKLFFKEEDLKRFLADGVYPFVSQKSAKPAKATKPEPTPKKAPETPSQSVQQDVGLPNPATPAEEALFNKLRNLRHDDGKSLREALSKAASALQIMFRYHSIPYDPKFHGPIDLIEDDLNIIEKNLRDVFEGNRIVSIEYKKATWYVQPQKNLFRVWIALQPPEYVVIDTVPAVEETKKPAKNPAKKETKSAEKQPKPKKEAKPAEKQPKPKKEEKTAKKAEPTPKAKKPQDNPNLIKPEGREPVKLTKRESSRKKAKAAPEQSEPTPKTPKPKKESKPAEKQPKPKKEAKPAEPQPKKKADKPAEQPKAKKLTHLEQALAAEPRLKANSSNPTYPLESKLKDLKAQLELVKKLKSEDRKKLTLNLDAIKAMIAKFEAEAK